MDKKRCGWVKPNDATYVAYHDDEWGKPLRDDQALFELFSLETQSAGLSWLTVLKKRDGYREAFDGFKLDKVALYNDNDIDRIIDSGLVIKSRPKIEAIVSNARLFMGIVAEFGSIGSYFWSKVDDKQIVNSVTSYKDSMTTSAISDEITRELKKQGFKFIGSVTIYAFMQACGMVDDHENDCIHKTKAL